MTIRRRVDIAPRPRLLLNCLRLIMDQLLVRGSSSCAGLYPNSIIKKYLAF